MGNDMNSLIANYLHKNKDVNLSQVKDSFEEIKENISGDDKTTLFDSSNGATDDQFFDMMNVNSDTVNKQTYQNSVNMLFDILDVNSDGELSSEEMDVIKLSSKNVVDEDGILQALAYDENEVQTNLSSLESVEEKAVSKSELPEGHKITDDGRILDSSGKEIGRIEVSFSDATGDGVSDKITRYFLYPEPKQTGDIPDGWQQNDDGTLTDENGRKLQAIGADEIENGDYDVRDGKIYDKSGKEVGRVVTTETDAKGNDGIEDTVDSYYLYVDEPQQDQGTSSSPSASSSSPSTSDSAPSNNADKEPISDEVAAIYADELYQATAGRLGTDDEQFESILNNEDLSAEDFVKIIAIYNEKYGSFIQDVEGDFSGEKQDTIMNKIADKLIEAAENGDEEAITLLCQEFYNGTAGMNGTADEFIGRIMSTASDEVLAKMLEQYAEVNDGADIITDIKKDFSGQTQDDYISKLNKVAGTAGKKDDVISDNVAMSYAKQLYEATENRWGTDENTVASILENPDLTSADIAKIVSMYNQEYGSMVNAIEGDFSGEDNEKYQKIIADALLEQAANGDEKALETLCKEFYNSTEGKNTTSDPFIEQIFKNASDEVLAKLVLMYGEVNDGADIFNAVKGDFSGEQEDSYIKKLNDALAKYRE